MKRIESVLLLKVPYAPYSDISEKTNNFKTKSPFRPNPSLALATICSFVEKHKSYDYDLRAVDINIEAYTYPNQAIDVSSYKDLLCDYIKNSQYDVLALSATFVFNVRWVDLAVRISREYHPEAKIVIGGGYPTLFPERCLKEHQVDDVIIGEGEATFLHLLNKYNNYRDPEFEKRFPLEGYATRNKEEEVIVIPKRGHLLPLEELPEPAWHFLNVEKYFKNSGDRYLPIEGSRGCPYSCSYCCTSLSWGRKVRYKSVDNLIKEIVEIKDRYNVDMLDFIDDNLSFKKKWFVEFLTRFIDLKLPLKIDASNFSVKDLDEERVDLLIKTGIESISIAIETGSPEIQKKIKKRLDLDSARNIVNMIQSKGARVHINWMIGFPGETLEQINETFNFARELGAYANQFVTVLPYPGTMLFEEAQQAELLMFDPDSLDKFDYKKCDYIKSNEWSYAQLQEMIYDINIEINFLNNPLLEIQEERGYMIDFFKKLLLRLPEHIIARIIIGYLYKQEGDMGECENYYRSVIELFKQESLHTTFSKYLSWDHPIIKDFNQSLTEKTVAILTSPTKMSPVVK